MGERLYDFDLDAGLIYNPGQWRFELREVGGRVVAWIRAEAVLRSLDKVEALHFWLVHTAHARPDEARDWAEQLIAQAYAVAGAPPEVSDGMV
jgi:hypothetical protein